MLVLLLKFLHKYLQNTIAIIVIRLALLILRVQIFPVSFNLFSSSDRCNFQLDEI